MLFTTDCNSDINTFLKAQRKVRIPTIYNPFHKILSFIANVRLNGMQYNIVFLYTTE